MSPAEIVIATRNPGKLAEIKGLLSHLPVRLLSLDSFADVPEVDEDRPTLEENAVKKAAEVARHTGRAAIADDTGLEVNALDGRPGVHSARYAGPESDPIANRALLLDELRDVADRRARFRTVVAFVTADETLVFEGICEGSIGTSERGTGGFGYDPLFVPDGSDRTFAELSLEEKNAVSHRGRALTELDTFLTTWLPGTLLD